jgi:integrase
MTTLRVFIRFCESIDAVEPGLHEQVIVPSVGEKDIRDETIEADRVEAILDYLHRYEYATRAHVVIRLLWSSSIRMGALLAIDVGDVDIEDLYVELCHRPQSDTPLKNGASSERLIAISDETGEVVKDWIDQNRPQVTDGYDRDPLIATTEGRMAGSSLRSLVYNVTRPCYRSDCECDSKYPHKSASKCDYSRSPHCFRKGSLTHRLKNEVPKDILSERADCSSEVLDRWYNKMTAEQKMEQRRDALNLD